MRGSEVSQVLLEAVPNILFFMYSFYLFDLFNDEILKSFRSECVPVVLLRNETFARNQASCVK